MNKLLIKEMLKMLTKHCMWREKINQGSLLSLGLTLITHTYIIGHYKPSVKIINLASHTIHLVYVNFIREWRDLQFKVAFDRQICWETFHHNFYLWCFLFYQKMCILFKRMQLCVCFLKMFRPLKGWYVVF